MDPAALERSGQASAVGVDVSEPALAHATAEAGRVRFQLEDAGQLTS
ncbi:class I SAM-dependent methyltransferase [Kineosporia mesophila]|nr:class I SAM-dependent methyltransferase [Kineosporia mesophila]MCD5354099.1 class I SAM-dependent methyltransferase [Kineosporia mesophila]